MYTKLLSNGSLLLQNVKEDREGFYLCQASNGIGTGIGKVVQVKVNCKYSYIIHHKCIIIQKNILLLQNILVVDEASIFIYKLFLFTIIILQTVA